MCRWTLADAEPQPRNNSPTGLSWSYSFTTPAGGINALQAWTTLATLTIPYTASLNMALTTGANLSVPTSGTYSGATYSPVVRATTARPHTGHLTHSTAFTSMQCTASAHGPEAR